MNRLAPHKDYFLDDSNLEGETFARRWFLILAWTTTRRIRMNFGFTFFEVSLIASGMGYKAKTEKEAENFNSIRVCQNRKLLLAGDFLEFVRLWNEQVQ